MHHHVMCFLTFFMKCLLRFYPVKLLMCVSLLSTRHRAINFFLKAYKERWLSNEESAQHLLIDDLTVSLAASITLHAIFPSLIVMVDALISRMSIATVERNSKLVNMHFYHRLVYDHDWFVLVKLFGNVIFRRYIDIFLYWRIKTNTNRQTDRQTKPVYEI